MIYCGASNPPPHRKRKAFRREHGQVKEAAEAFASAERWAQTSCSTFNWGKETPRFGRHKGGEERKPRALVIAACTGGSNVCVLNSCNRTASFEQQTETRTSLPVGVSTPVHGHFRFHLPIRILLPRKRAPRGNM